MPSSTVKMSERRLSPVVAAAAMVCGLGLFGVWIWIEEIQNRNRLLDLAGRNRQ